MHPTVMVAITGVWNRSETWVSFSGASRSNDQANMFRVPIMNPVGVHQRIAIRKVNAMKMSSHCGPGRKWTSEGRYGRNGAFQLDEPPPRPSNTSEPKNWKP